MVDRVDHELFLLRNHRKLLERKHHYKDMYRRENYHVLTTHAKKDKKIIESVNRKAEKRNQEILQRLEDIAKRLPLAEDQSSYLSRRLETEKLSYVNTLGQKYPEFSQKALSPIRSVELPRRGRKPFRRPDRMFRSVDSTNAVGYDWKRIARSLGSDSEDDGDIVNTEGIEEKGRFDVGMEDINAEQMRKNKFRKHDPTASDMADYGDDEDPVTEAILSHQDNQPFVKTNDLGFKRDAIKELSEKDTDIQDILRESKQWYEHLLHEKDAEVEALQKQIKRRDTENTILKQKVVEERVSKAKSPQKNKLPELQATINHLTEKNQIYRNQITTLEDQLSTTKSQISTLEVQTSILEGKTKSTATISQQVKSKYEDTIKSLSSQLAQSVSKEAHQFLKDEVSQLYADMQKLRHQRVNQTGELNETIREKEVQIEALKLQIDQQRRFDVLKAMVADVGVGTGGEIGVKDHHLDPILIEDQSVWVEKVERYEKKLRKWEEFQSRMEKTVEDFRFDNHVLRDQLEYVQVTLAAIKGDLEKAFEHNDRKGVGVKVVLAVLDQIEKVMKLERSEAEEPMVDVRRSIESVERSRMTMSGENFSRLDEEINEKAHEGTINQMTSSHKVSLGEIKGRMEFTSPSASEISAKTRDSRTLNPSNYISPSGGFVSPGIFSDLTSPEGAEGIREFPQSSSLNSMGLCEIREHGDEEVSITTGGFPSKDTSRLETILESYDVDTRTKKVEILTSRILPNMGERFLEQYLRSSPQLSPEEVLEFVESVDESTCIDQANLILPTDAIVNLLRTSPKELLSLDVLTKSSLSFAETTGYLTREYRPVFRMFYHFITEMCKRNSQYDENYLREAANLITSVMFNHGIPPENKEKSLEVFFCILDQLSNQMALSDFRIEVREDEQGVTGGESKEVTIIDADIPNRLQEISSLSRDPAKGTFNDLSSDEFYECEELTHGGKSTNSEGFITANASKISGITLSKRNKGSFVSEMSIDQGLFVHDANNKSVHSCKQ